MPENSIDRTGPPLHRTLNLKDLVLLNISCIVSLSSLAQISQFGFATLTLCFVAILTFLIPSGLMVAELNARMPAQGGFYLWTRTAFGDLHGYIAAWTYWLSTIVWFPTVLMLISVSSLYMFGDKFLGLADSPWYNAILCLGIVWLVTVLNLFGMERAKWVQNVGGIAIWICVALLLVLGIVFITNHESGHPFSLNKLIPDITDFSLLPFFAMVAFSFGGLELAPVMAGEINNPRRNIPRAIIFSSISVGLIYMAGTLMLIFILPEGEIGIIEGVTQAFYQVSSTIGIPGVGIVGAMLVALGTMGLLGAWMTGTARVPFVIGLDHYLPEAFGKIHPRWGSPYVSLLMQGVVLTVLFLASIAGSTVKEAFLVLMDMAIILYFIPFLYMFAALVWHITRNTGDKGIIGAFQKSTAAVWLVAILGFGTILFSIIIACVPTKDIENKELFLIKVVGGPALLIGVGLVVYYLKKRDDR